MGVSTKQKREAVFHDKIFSSGGRYADRFYSIQRSSKAFYRQYIIDRCTQKRVLEYGCGPDSHAMLFVPKGAKVVGVDISRVAIEEYRRVVSEHEVSGVEACVMNAEELAFADKSIDIICGLGILHHLDLTRSFTELSRILKPGGSAIFLEPLAHNPLIRLYRRLTPKMRTPDEHPLTISDLKGAERYFNRIETKYFHLVSLAAVVINGRRGFNGLLQLLDKVDERLLGHCQALQRYAWAVALILSEPKQDKE
jgi:ubiquinone/menaquinone biosynthesis C-methylase UbiE